MYAIKYVVYCELVLQHTRSHLNILRLDGCVLCSPIEDFLVGETETEWTW